MTDDLTAQLGLRKAARVFAGTAFGAHLPALEKLALDRMSQHGTFPRWLEAIATLTQSTPWSVELNAEAPLATCDGRKLKERELEALKVLCPFKKGPFRLAGTLIDSEWRSDFKWQRLKEHGVQWTGKNVLDVGTGNGYFLYRIAGEGASFALGLEPSSLFACQFMALQKFYACEKAALLPVKCEQMPLSSPAFDLVMSMGVLYHRRSPLDHLRQLLAFLKPGGELVLETLVTPGPLGHALLPDGRYAEMPNVWFLPSIETLVSWLVRMGATEIRAGAPVPTTSEEQRATDWSTGKSLKDFLDPKDPAFTVEGHPAPTRVIVTARKPL